MSNHHSSRTDTSLNSMPPVPSEPMMNPEDERYEQPQIPEIEEEKLNNDNLNAPKRQIIIEDQEQNANLDCCSSCNLI